MVAFPGSIGICVHCRAGWTTRIFLFVSGDGRLCSGDGFSDAFSDGMAASGAVLAVSFTGVHENPEECGGESRAHEVLKHLLLRVQAPVIVQRQVLQSRQCSTAWTGQLMVAMS